jgi:hypothetical protein
MTTLCTTTLDGLFYDIYLEAAKQWAESTGIAVDEDTDVDDYREEFKASSAHKEFKQWIEERAYHNLYL